jgi:hypothetical protein
LWSNQRPQATLHQLHSAAELWVMPEMLLLRAQRRYPAKAQHLTLDPSPPLH